MFDNVLTRTFGMGPYVVLSFLIVECLTYMSLNIISLPLNLSFAVQVIAVIPFIVAFTAGYFWFLNVYLTYSVGTKVLKTGLFRCVRHPLYSMAVILLPPVVIIWLNNGIFIISWVAIIAIVHFLVKKEEQYMENKFGAEYTEYKSKVPALLPYKGIVNL